jgi:RHS repeat-associated protein
MKHNIYISLLIVAIVYTLSVEVTAQYNTYDFRNMQAPNTASMIRSNFFQENPYTGRINVNVPLHSIESKGMNMPISINHNTGGVQLNDHPGWVGQNWNLDVGGVITRKTEGFPDEFGFDPNNPSAINSKYYSYYSFLENNNISLTESMNNSEEELISTIELITSNIATQSIPNPDYNNNYDTEADIFSFNVMGISGSFFLGTDGKWKVRSDRNIKVEMDYKNESSYISSLFASPPLANWSCPGYDYFSVIKGFIIIDDLGNRYHFGFEKEAIEFSVPFFQQIDLTKRTHWTADSWKLTKIENFNNEVLFEIKYERGNMIADFYRGGESWHGGQWYCIGQEVANQSSVPESSVKKAGDPWVIGGTLRAPSNLQEVESYFGEKVTFETENSSQINYEWLGDGLNGANDEHANYFNSVSSCITPSGDVRAIYPFLLIVPYPYGVPGVDQYAQYSGNPSAANPYDALVWEKLVKIKSNLANGDLNRSITFCYNDDADERLKLENLTISGTDSQCGEANSDDLQYSFEYFQFDQLTGYLQRNIDHWGYMNSTTHNHNSQLLFEETQGDIYPFMFPLPQYPEYFIRSSFLTTRNANGNVGKYGSLNKIIFPTGGYQTIAYEGNKASHFITDDRQNVSLITNSSFNGLMLSDVGGIRVDSVSLHDADGEQISSRKFVYDKALLSVKPKYAWMDYTHDYYEFNYTSGEYEFDCNNKQRFTKATYAAVSSLGNLTESHICYPEVTEIYNDGSAIRRTYTSYFDILTRDEGPIASTNPELNPATKFSDLSFLRGKPKIVEFFEGSKRKRKVENKYRFEDFSPKEIFNDASLKLSHNSLQGDGAAIYASIARRYYFKDMLKNSNTINFEDNGMIVFEENYIHDTQNVNGNEYTWLFSSNKSDGNGVAKETIFKYPKDVVTSSSNDLQLRHATNLQLESKVNDGNGGGQKVEFFNLGGGFLVPKYIYSANNGSSVNGSWKLQTTFSYDNYLDTYPDRIKRRSNTKNTLIYWDGYMSRLGLPNLVYYGSRVWDFDYNNKRLLERMTDNNSIQSTYVYDGLDRLESSSSNNGNVTSDVVYNISHTGAENFIESTVSYDENGPLTFTTKSIFDGIGRTLSVNKNEYTQSGADYITSSTYGEFNEVLTSTDPGTGGTSSFMYENSPLRRLKETTPAGSSRSITQVYGTNTEDIGGYPAETLHKTSITDENGNISVSYKDIFGRQIASVIDESGENLMTTYTYNDRDQILTIQPPIGAQYVYTYYDDGLLETKTIPDKGEYIYTYNDQDQLKSETLPNGKVLTYVYDADYNDFLTQVLLDGTIIKEYSFFDDSKDWLGKEELAIFRPNGSILPQKNITTYSDPDYAFGRFKHMNVVTMDGEYDEDLTYDNMGNMLNNNTSLTGPDGTTRNIVTDISYSKGIRRNSNWTTIEGIDLGTKNFTYNESDWLTISQLGEGIQTIDYGYNPRGWLTSINGVNQTYLNNDPCVDITDDPEFSDVDCEKIIDIVQYFILLYNCDDITLGNPTGFQLKNTNQYFNGESIAQAATSNTYEISINGGVVDENINLPNIVEFSIGDGGISNDDMGQGLLETLIDCIQGDSMLLEDINQAIQDLLNIVPNGPNGPSDPNGSGPVNPATNNNSDVFGMEIHYEDGNGELSAVPQYNGNISWIEWRTKTDQRHAYGFTYDGANRLESAFYGEDDPNTKECKIEKTDKYSVPSITYDDLGNIEVLLRNGIKDYGANGSSPEYGPIDKLGYDYLPGTSLLASVLDNSSENFGFQGSNSSYGYEHGNLITDSQKGINKITYSYNDLPLTIDTDKGKIRNWYTADGQKVRSSVGEDGGTTSITDPIITNYIASAEYVNDKIQFIAAEEGRVIWGEDGKAYPEYFLKDHLGNVRARIADKNGDNLVNVDPNNPEEDELMNIRHYYPFGMEWDMHLKDMAGNSLEESEVKNKYTYNGKEFQEELGVNLHYYGFRVYDPAIGRFTSVDPIAEEFAFVSGFNYAENEPIANIDLHGLQKYYAADGSFITSKGDDQTIRIIPTTRGLDFSGFSSDVLNQISLIAQESTKKNMEESLIVFAADNQNMNAYGGKERAMSLFEGTITESDGSTKNVFVESKVAEGRSHSVDMRNIESPIDGWKKTATIHTHPNSTSFSPEGSFGGGDVGYSRRNDVMLYVTNPYGKHIQSFNPGIYKSARAMGASYEEAQKAATKKKAITLTKKPKI